MHAVLYYPLIATTTYLATTVTFLALHLLISHVVILGFIYRCLAAYGSLVICAAYGTIASFCLRIFGQHFAYGQWTTARSFKWVMRYTIGVRFEILDDGETLLNHTRPMVIIGNHQTELDILLLGCIWPQHCSVSAKKSLRWTPFLGWFMMLSGTVFIDRVRRESAMKAFEGAASAMRELRQSVFIFPEGTRSYAAQPTLLPFKKGAFHLAVQAGADILPVVAENYSQILNVKAKRFRAGTIRVKVLPPIPTKNLTSADVNKLAEETRMKMLETLEQFASQPESRSRSMSDAEAKKLA